MNFRTIIKGIAYKGLLNWMPDTIYLKILYWASMGEKLNLDNPQGFNEKLQWLKLYDRNSTYTTLVDKYAVKKCIADEIGSEYIIPTLGVWDSFNDIEFDALPDQFVLKCIHDSGGLVVCTDKNNLNKELAKQKIESSLKKNYYYSGREWPYKNVPHKIVAEQYMADDLHDYKSLGIKRMPRVKLVYSECLEKTGLKEYFFDEVWNHLNVQKRVESNAIFKMQRSKQFELLHQLSTKLSKKISFTRIDFYEIDENSYWGEITFHPAKGFDDFQPEEWNLNLGEWTKLSSKGYRLNTGNCSVIITDTYYNAKETKALIDYKFFCFDGVAESVMVCTERETGNPKFYFFDKEWNLKRYNIRGKEAPEDFSLTKPDCIDEMFSIAEKLSKGIPYVRVDLYCINGLVYFGEMTFYPDSGFDANLLKESDAYWGNLLVLPERKG